MGKIEKLNKILKNLKSAVIAYSGGVDSTFLVKAAVDALGKQNVLAVTARSETYPNSEYERARKIAGQIGARHIAVSTKELNLKNFRSNPVNRCYYCKRELFKKLNGIRSRYGMAYVLDGTNIDDLKDIRFGRKAAFELRVKSPLLEAGITKDDVRRLSRKLKLPTWNKPALACLASRIPFNNYIAPRDLRRIDKAEDYLRRLGFRQVRVRLHGSIARIEIAKKDFVRAVRLKEAILKRLGALGFVYIALDLAGYRTGSMHEAAP